MGRTDPESLARRADAYCCLEQYDLALADYGRLLELDAEDIDAMTRRGRIFLAMGRPEDALPDLSKAVEIDPSLAEELQPYLTACSARGEPVEKTPECVLKDR